MGDSKTSQIKGAVRERINNNWKVIKGSVPEGTNAVRLINIALTAIDMNPSIAKCSFESIVSAVTLAATVGIEPNDGTNRAWFIPRKGDLKYELSYQGHCDLMYKSGRVALVDSHSVFANDTFEANQGTDARIVHKPAMKDRGELIGAYAVVWIHGTNRALVEVLTHDDMMKIRAMSSARSGPWFDWPEEMARGKAIKRVSKRAPIDAVSRRAFVALDKADARVSVESVLGKDAWESLKARKDEASDQQSPKEVIEEQDQTSEPTKGAGS